MKPQAIIRELLLFTDTSFAKRELACWSGLIFEMFPDLFNRSDRKNMCVWKVNQAEQFIHVELGSTSVSPEHKTSIDPYFFLPLVIYHN